MKSALREQRRQENGERRFGHVGFTLIELLVSIAVIRILVSLALPALSRAKRMDGSTVLTACSRYMPVSTMENELFLWEAKTGRRPNRSPMLHPFTFLYAAFSPEGRRLLACISTVSICWHFFPPQYALISTRW